MNTIVFVAFCAYLNFAFLSKLQILTDAGQYVIRFGTSDIVLQSGPASLVIFFKKMKWVTGSLFDILQNVSNYLSFWFRSKSYR